MLHCSPYIKIFHECDINSQKKKKHRERHCVLPLQNCNADMLKRTPQGDVIIMLIIKIKIKSAGPAHNNGGT